jgi:hypothetical protein
MLDIRRPPKPADACGFAAQGHLCALAKHHSGQHCTLTGLLFDEHGNYKGHHTPPYAKWFELCEPLWQGVHDGQS